MSTPKTTAPTAPTPSKLQLAVANLSESTAAMHREFAKQADRLAEIPALELEKEAILSGSENGLLTLDDATARLSSVDAKIVLLRHGAERRGNALDPEFLAHRGKLIELKRTVLGAVSSAQRQQIAIRQGEVRQFLKSWGGTSQDPTAYPAAIAAIAAGCPTFTRLESLRGELDQWDSSKAASALLRAARAAADFVAGLNLPDGEPSEEFEPRLQEPNAILAWTPGRDCWDLYAVAKDHVEAQDAFHRLSQHSTLCGFRKFALLSSRAAARTDRYQNSGNRLLGEIAADRNHFREKGYVGPDKRFLTESATWLAI